MKLMRHGPKGFERPALIDAAGSVRDLSGVLPDLTAATLGRTQLAALAALDPASLPLVATPGRIAPPYAGIGKFICVGLNYADHAAESGLPVPPEPVLFMKATSAVIGANDAVVLPQGSEKSDWEVELRDQRPVRAELPARARRHLGQGQGVRHLRPGRPLAGHGR
jgi:2,4-diketo-3-deoxy-L-fuconate hydrolase